jgi:hypothetical protein
MLTEWYGCAHEMSRSGKREEGSGKREAGRGKREARGGLGLDRSSPVGLQGFR